MYHQLARTGVGALVLTLVAIVMGTAGFVTRAWAKRTAR